MLTWKGIDWPSSYPSCRILCVNHSPAIGPIAVQCSTAFLASVLRIVENLL